VAGKPQAACRNRGDGDRKIQKSQIFFSSFCPFLDGQSGAEDPSFLNKRISFIG
jgi:hypothetical protein